MASSAEDPAETLLHIIVVGFHHKKGCQIEYSYPPLVAGSPEESGDTPTEWKHLPTLALPDGSHNYSKDTVYFHLKDKGKNSTVYGVSCYRQMDAKDVINRTEDITRGTVQKSICVLTTLPYYGAIAAKLELVTHAWFEQKDFTRVELLREAYNSLAASLPSCPSLESQALMGVRIHDVVKLYRHKLLVLFKLLMLERKTVYFMTPVSDLCNVILSVISLFPGLLEQGLVESVNNSKLIHQTFTNEHLIPASDDKPFVDLKYSPKEVPQSHNPNSSDQIAADSEVLTNQELCSSDSTKRTSNSDSNDIIASHDQVTNGTNKHGREGTVNDPAAGDSNLGKSVDSQVEVTAPLIPAIDSEDFIKEIDLEDQQTVMWDTQKSSLTLSDDCMPSISVAVEERKSAALSNNSSRPDSLDLNTSSAKLEVIPVVSPTGIHIDKAGLPLAIFTKGSVCHPYLSLSYYDILEDVNTRSFVIGATNVLYKQKRHNVDVIVEDRPESISIQDKALARQLQLSTEDMRFADSICQRVDQTVASGEFLENTEWEGGDEWIRAEFKDYLLSLMASVLAEDQHLLQAFNPHFVDAWKTTHNYRVWRSTVQQLDHVIPGHPCQGGVTLNDVKLQLARTERGRKLNAVVDQAGKAVSDTTKAVGGAFKSYVSSWWSNLGSPNS